MNVKKLLGILIFCCFSILKGQSPLEAQFQAAEKLFQSESYFDAITEYKRLLFFDSKKQYSYEGNFKIAMCYKMGAKFDDAVFYFAKAEIAASNPDDKFTTAMQIVRTNILRRTCSRALELLDIYGKEPAYKSKLDEIMYWRGWAYMFTGDFENAANRFGSFSGGEELKKLCLQGSDEKYSVSFAKILSFIIPGAGQIYTGEILSGILSFGWNVLFGYMTVGAFADNRILDGTLIGGLLFLRFYRGNVQNAEKFALNKNLDIINKILKYIQSNYKGIKP